MRNLAAKAKRVIVLVLWLLALCAVSSIFIFAQPATKAKRKPGHLCPPSRIESLESGERDKWQKSDEIMDALQIKPGRVVADVGAGGGYFTVKLARRVEESGAVYAVDIQKEMIAHIDQRVQKEALKNVKTILGEPADPKLPENALDTVLVIDTYHEVTDPVVWLQNIKKGLKPSGQLAIIDFKKELKEGPGPPQKDRLPEKTVIKEAKQAGFRLLRKEIFLPYQYMLVFVKK
jgi:ubiquinone/menaquinone biosynthesis C-methylase UbiE